MSLDNLSRSFIKSQILSPFDPPPLQQQNPDRNNNNNNNDNTSSAITGTRPFKDQQYRDLNYRYGDEVSGGNKITVKPRQSINLQVIELTQRDLLHYVPPPSNNDCPQTQPSPQLNPSKTLYMALSDGNDMVWALIAPIETQNLLGSKAEECKRLRELAEEVERGAIISIDSFAVIPAANQRPLMVILEGGFYADFDVVTASLIGNPEVPLDFGLSPHSLIHSTQKYHTSHGGGGVSKNNMMNNNSGLNNSNSSRRGRSSVSVPRRGKSLGSTGSGMMMRKSSMSSTTNGVFVPVTSLTRDGRLVPHERFTFKIREVVEKILGNACIVDNDDSTNTNHSNNNNSNTTSQQQQQTIALSSNSNTNHNSVVRVTPVYHDQGLSNNNNHNTMSQIQPQQHHSSNMLTMRNSNHLTNSNNTYHRNNNSYYDNNNNNNDDGHLLIGESISQRPSVSPSRNNNNNNNGDHQSGQQQQEQNSSTSLTTAAFNQSRLHWRIFGKITWVSKVRKVDIPEEFNSSLYEFGGKEDDEYDCVDENNNVSAVTTDGAHDTSSAYSRNSSNHQNNDDNSNNNNNNNRYHNYNRRAKKLTNAQAFMKYCEKQEQKKKNNNNIDNSNGTHHPVGITESALVADIRITDHLGDSITVVLRFTKLKDKMSEVFGMIGDVVVLQNAVLEAAVPWDDDDDEEEDNNNDNDDDMHIMNQKTLPQSVLDMIMMTEESSSVSPSSNNSDDHNQHHQRKIIRKYFKLYKKFLHDRAQRFGGIAGDGGLFLVVDEEDIRNKLVLEMNNAKKYKLMDDIVRKADPQEKMAFLRHSPRLMMSSKTIDFSCTGDIFGSIFKAGGALHREERRLMKEVASRNNNSNQTNNSFIVNPIAVVDKFSVVGIVRWVSEKAQMTMNNNNNNKNNNFNNNQPVSRRIVILSDVNLHSALAVLTLWGLNADLIDEECVGTTVGLRDIKIVPPTQYDTRHEFLKTYSQHLSSINYFSNNNDNDDENNNNVNNNHLMTMMKLTTNRNNQRNNKKQAGVICGFRQRGGSEVILYTSTGGLSSENENGHNNQVGGGSSLSFRRVVVHENGERFNRQEANRQLVARMVSKSSGHVLKATILEKNLLERRSQQGVESQLLLANNNNNNNNIDNGYNNNNAYSTERPSHNHQDEIVQQQQQSQFNNKNSTTNSTNKDDVPSGNSNIMGVLQNHHHHHRVIVPQLYKSPSTIINFNDRLNPDLWYHFASSSSTVIYSLFDYSLLIDTLKTTWEKHLSPQEQFTILKAVLQKQQMPHHQFSQTTTTQTETQQTQTQQTQTQQSQLSSILFPIELHPHLRARIEKINLPLEYSSASSSSTEKNNNNNNININTSSVTAAAIDDAAAPAPAPSRSSSSSSAYYFIKMSCSNPGCYAPFSHKEIEPHLKQRAKKLFQDHHHQNQTTTTTTSLLLQSTRPAKTSSTLFTSSSITCKSCKHVYRELDQLNLNTTIKVQLSDGACQRSNIQLDDPLQILDVAKMVAAINNNNNNNNVVLPANNNSSSLPKLDFCALIYKLVHAWQNVRNNISVNNNNNQSSSSLLGHAQNAESLFSSFIKDEFLVRPCKVKLIEDTQLYSVEPSIQTDEKEDMQNNNNNVESSSSSSSKALLGGIDQLLDMINVVTSTGNHQVAVDEDDSH